MNLAYILHLNILHLTCSTYIGSDVHKHLFWRSRINLSCMFSEIISVNPVFLKMCFVIIIILDIPNHCHMTQGGRVAQQRPRESLGRRA